MPTPQNPSTISQPIGAPMVMSGGGPMMMMSGGYQQQQPQYGGSISMPIMYGSMSIPNAVSSVQQPQMMQSMGSGIPAVGAKQYPEGQPVGTLPYEVPPYPEDTPLTEALCRTLQVPLGTLWGGMVDGGANITTQEV